MTDRTGFRVVGLRDVVAALLQMGADVEDLKAAFSEVAAEGARAASRFAPRRTGRLAGDVRGNRAKSKAVITAGRASVPYAGAINYGWPRRHIAPSLFMQKADKEVQPTAVLLLEREVNRQIRKKKFK